MKFEALLEAAGGFGRHQIYMLIWNQLVILLLSSNVLFMVFAIYDKVPPDDCISPDNYTMWNSSNSVNESKPVVCFTSYFFSPIIEWKLLGVHKYLATAILTIQMFGVFLGPIIFGQTADLFGRKLMLTIAIICATVVGGLSSLSSSWQVFAAARFILGIFGGGVGILHNVIMFEVVLPRHRLLVQIGGWPIGYMWTAALAALFRSWRSMVIASNLFGIIPIILTFFCCYESPKWLLEKKRYAEAKVVLMKIAERNGISPAKVEKIFDERHGKALLEDADAPPKKVYSYWHLFRNKTAAVHTLGLMLLTFTTSTLSYTITFSIKDLAGDPALTTFFFGLLRLPITLVVPYLDRRLKWLGRRVSIQIGLLGMTSCFGVLTVLFFIYPKATALMAFKVFSLSSGVLAGIIWMTVSLYCAELFPTALRSMGMAMNGFAARIGNLVSPALVILYLLYYMYYYM